MSRSGRDTSTRNRRPGASLVFTGLAGVIFFWVTDQRYGLASRLTRAAA